MKCKNRNTCEHKKETHSCFGCSVNEVINGFEEKIYTERFSLYRNNKRMHDAYLKGKWDEGFSFIDFCHLKATQDIKNIKEQIED